jgi:hypothetical protein
MAELSYWNTLVWFRGASICRWYQAYGQKS